MAFFVAVTGNFIAFDHLAVYETAKVTLLKVKVKGKASSLDIAPLTILNSGALQPRKWQLTGIDCNIDVKTFLCSVITGLP